MTNRPLAKWLSARGNGVGGVWSSISGPVKLVQCRQQLAPAATFLRSCVAQALSYGDGPLHSLHS